MNSRILKSVFATMAMATASVALGQTSTQPVPVAVQPPAPASPAPKQAAKGVQSVITVLLPVENAELKIDGKVMKTTGKKRDFDTPELQADKEYEYVFEAQIKPNNYTTITRRLVASFKSGTPLTVDLTKEREDDKVMIRYVPTPEDIVVQMLKLGKVSKEDVVYDLGCGDARMVIAAVKESGAKKGVGIDIDPERVVESKGNVTKEKVDKQIEIRQGDILDDKVLAQASEATVVLIYLSDELNSKLKPKFLKILKPGTRIVSHRFTMGDWKPEKTQEITGEDGDKYLLHLWIVPEKK
jgi:uncharacterized protein (TIGR03000 family)